MGKSYTKKTVKNKKYKLSSKEAEIIIRHEFTDNKGNYNLIKYDIFPQKWNEPTIEIENRSRYKRDK